MFYSDMINGNIIFVVGLGVIPAAICAGATGGSSPTDSIHSAQAEEHAKEFWPPELKRPGVKTLEFADDF